MTFLARFKLFLWSFGKFQVPLIGHLKPKLISIDEQKVVIKLPLKRRSKNHLNSMYFGALAVGADLAGALHSFYFTKQNNIQASIVFKSFQANFLRRPENDVYFVCESGNKIKSMLAESKQHGQRINELIHVKAFTNYPINPEEIANFNLELSIKVLTHH